MSIYRVTKNDFETFSVITNPLRHYTSSSTQGVTGSVYVFARRSSIEKEVEPSSAFVESIRSDADINGVLGSIQRESKLIVSNPGIFDRVSLTEPLLPSSTIYTGFFSGSAMLMTVSGAYTGSGPVTFPHVVSGSSSFGTLTLTGGTFVGPSVSLSGTFSVVPGVNFITGTAIQGSKSSLTLFSASIVNLKFSGSFLSTSLGTPKPLFYKMMSGYLDKVNAQSMSARKRKALDIIRFTPSFSFTSNTLRKLVVKDILNKYYRTSKPTAHWAYTNYNTLNFFTSSAVPSGSALLYPNIDTPIPHDGYVSGTYNLSGAFSFDFYINPRYTSFAPDGSYKAGTLFHLSSSYAVSLVSGSAKDENGRPTGFRIKLQLSHSADVSPSLAVPGTSFPNNLTFLSDDNSLQHNRWHHVVIRWGTNLVNDGTGSFNIDQVDRGLFVVPSGTVNLRRFGQPPSILAIGNYYEGWDSMSQFLAHDPALRDGLQEMNSAAGVEEPTQYHFRHPLNAEVHDLAIKRYYMSDTDIAVSASVGPTRIEEDRVAFYLPPFFVTESPFRQFVGAHGGILQTPFFEVDGTTNDPFNVALAFGVGGHYINVENFLRDFSANVFPRVHLLTASAINYTTTARSANDFLYDSPSVRYRNLLIMPCDDGLFVPSFELLASESVTAHYVDDLNVEEFGFINLDDMVLTQSLLFGTSFDAPDEDDNDFVDQQIGFTPESPGLQPGPAFTNYMRSIDKAVASGTFDPGIQDNAPLTIYQRTRDASSNQVTFFDISNLFYGRRILPGSFELRDPSMSGSTGAISVTLKDDKYGNLYRADSLTSASTWNSVGNIYYDEGIAVIKSPHLYFFGKEGYEVSFRGEQSVHVLKIDAMAPANQLNSSSNPNFKPVHPSGLPNDPDSEFVYITSINFHDDNYNVIMKAQLAQPIMKRHGERIGFKVKVDM